MSTEYWTWVLYAYYTCNSLVWPVKKPEGSWKTTVDYWELNKMVPLHPCIYVQHYHHLKYLGHGPKSIPCYTGFNKCFFLVHTWPLSHRSIFLHMRGATKGLPSASLMLPTQPQNVPWDVNPRSIPVPPSHISKWTHYTDDIMSTCENLPLLQDTQPTVVEHLQGRGWVVNLQKI